MTSDEELICKIIKKRYVVIDTMEEAREKWKTIQKENDLFAFGVKDILNFMRSARKDQDQKTRQELERKAEAFAKGIKIELNGTMTRLAGRIYSPHFAERKYSPHLVKDVYWMVLVNMLICGLISKESFKKLETKKVADGPKHNECINKECRYVWYSKEKAEHCPKCGWYQEKESGSGSPEGKASVATKTGVRIPPAAAITFKMPICECGHYLYSHHNREAVCVIEGCGCPKFKLKKEGEE